MLTECESIRLNELRIQAFRGVGPEVCLDFDAPTVILFGGNHTGKSSILNAVDWILFSKDCFQGPLVTDRLRERVSWEIRNRHAAASLGTRCTAVFSNIKTTCELTRSLSGARSRSSTGLRIKTFDGRELTDDPAEHFIATRICASFRDFMSTVYLHQEVIRDVLTIKPEERGDAIDRLLGLAPLRDLARTLKDAKWGRFTDSLDSQIRGFEEQLDAVRRDRERRIAEHQSKAAQHRLEGRDLTYQRALGLASESLDRLKSVVLGAGLGAPELELPTDEKDLERYISQLQESVQRARTDLPDVRKLSGLTQRKTALSDARAQYEERLRQRNDARQKLADFVREKGDRANLVSRRAERAEGRQRKAREFREHDARAATIRDSIQYIRALPSPTEATKCPVCGKHVDGDELLKHLEQEAAERLDAQSQALSRDIEQLDQELGRIGQALQTLGQLESDLNGAETGLRQQTASVTAVLQIELKEQDDPKALLERKVAEVDDDLRRRKAAADRRLNELTEIERQYVEPARLIRDVLKERASVQRLGEIQQHFEFKSLRTLQRRAATLKGATEAIGTAAAAVSQNAAKLCVERAGQRAQDVFVKVAGHPTVRDIRLIVGQKTVGGIHRNEYSIEDADGNSLVPVLSQGDMNALGLGLFVGLGLSTHSLGLGFMIFDDPTQSLAQPQKDRFAEVLNEVAASRQVIVATMDSEFLEALRSRITKRKRVYQFRSWTPDAGPEVVAELD